MYWFLCVDFFSFIHFSLETQFKIKKKLVRLGHKMWTIYMVGNLMKKVLYKGNFIEFLCFQIFSINQKNNLFTSLKKVSFYFCIIMFFSFFTITSRTIILKLIDKQKKWILWLKTVFLNSIMHFKFFMFIFIILLYRGA